MKKLLALQQKFGNQVIAFKIGEVIICTWGVFCIAGAFIGLMLISSQLAFQGFSSKAINGIILSICLCSILGSKIFGLLTKYKHLLANPTQALRTNRFNFYGGIFFGTVCTFAWAQADHRQLFVLWDSIALSLPLAQAVGRLGCLAHGCCHGCPTNSRFGVEVTNPLSVAVRISHFPLGTRLYPIQTITSFCNLLLFALLQGLVISFKQLPAGLLSTVYLIVENGVRFVLDYFRDERAEPSVFGITVHQVFAAVFFAFGVGVLIFICKSALSNTTFCSAGYVFTAPVGSAYWQSIPAILFGLLIVSPFAVNFRTIGKM